MGHQQTYRHNQAYAEFLANWDEGFYAKYADTLAPEKPGARVLDVGCGVGQVLRRLIESGFEAHGVEVSEPNLEKARQVTVNCQLYDGLQLPFPNDYFASVGALNVLEHVEQPEAFVAEIARVAEPKGKIVLSSPNFFRGIGWRDYHPKMRGLRNKWRNLRRLLQKRRTMRRAPEIVRFDRMTPIVKEPFTPDDDAIVATNALEMAFFLKRAGCDIEEISCTDRYVPRWLDLAVNLTPVRYLMLNAFVVARKRDTKKWIVGGEM